MRRKDTGFSLIEIMVAIAIVAILASVVLVSMTAFRSKARSAKALAQVSSVIPSMISCWGNGGTVSAASGGANICSLAASFGQWPQTAGDLGSYSYGGTISGSTNWFVLLTSGTENRICCNSKMNSCKIQYYVSGAWEAGCDATTPSY